MDTVLEKKDALAVLGLAAAGFLLLVATTASYEYGMPLMSQDRLIWSLTRFVPALGWFSVAALLMVFREEIVWESAAMVFSVTLIIACAGIVMVQPHGINPTPVMLSVMYYALTSGLLCITVRRPIFAALIGPGVFALQVITDVAAHLGTGVLQIGC